MPPEPMPATKPAVKKLTLFSAPSVAAATLAESLRLSFNGAAIDRIDAAALLQPDSLNADTLAFFLPGIAGDDSPYGTHIGAPGNAVIRKYVEDGGVFVGICAGAYYACSDIVYDPPWRAAAKTSRPGLDFFNGLARGPQPGYGLNNHENWFSDCRVIPVSSAGGGGENDGAAKTALAYGNGPALYPHNIHNNHNVDHKDDLEIIARYEDVPGRPAAIAARRISKGLALFVGVLPYIGFSPEHAASRHTGLRDLMRALQPHEEGRRAIWDDIVLRIKQHNADTGRVRLLPRPAPPPA